MLNQQQEIYLFFFGQFFISRIASTATDGKERNLVDDGGFGPVVYLSFFLGRMFEVWPHFFLRQLVARGWSLA